MVLALALLLAGCGGARPTSGLGGKRVLERGTLTYQLAMVGTRMLVSTELGLRFELVVRRLDSGATTELGRLDLGPPDWDTTGLAAASSGPIVWVSSRDGTVRAIDVSRMVVLHRWPVGAAVTAIAASARGDRVAYGTSEGVVCLRRVADGALLQCLHQSTDEISSLAFGGDGDVLASGTSGGALTLLSATTLASRSTRSVGGPVAALAFSADGSLALAIGERPGRSRLGRGAVIVLSNNSEQLVRCDGHRDSVTALAWMRGNVLASGSIDGTLRAWRPRPSGCEAAGAQRYEGPVSSIVNSENNSENNSGNNSGNNVESNSENNSQAAPARATVATVAIGLWATEGRRESVLLVPYLWSAP